MFAPLIYTVAIIAAFFTFCSLLRGAVAAADWALAYSSRLATLTALAGAIFAIGCGVQVAFLIAGLA